MMNRQRSYLIKFVLLALPYLLFSNTLPLACTHKSLVKKFPYLTNLFTAYKKNTNQQEKAHSLRQPLLWATAASGALLMAYIYFRQQSPTLTPVTTPASASDTQNLPSTPRLDPDVLQKLRTSITGLDGAIPALDNAFSAGHAVREKQENLGRLLGSRLPKNSISSPRE